MQTALEAFRVFRAKIKEEHGNNVIRDLHLQTPWIDWSVFASILSLFFFLMYSLYTVNFGVLWTFCAIAQGFVMQGIGFFAHDAFTHRRVGGKTLSYIGNIFCTIPFFRLPTKFYELHILHHLHLNTKNDPEVEVLTAMGNQTRLKTLMLFSIFGHLSIVFKWETKLKASKKYIAKINREKVMRIAFFFLISTLTVLFPAFFIYGYWLPLIVVFPPITIFRILLEHGEINPENPIQAVTNYRSGMLFKVLHMFDGGDCHLIHHIYPNIPFYNISKAIKLLKPKLEQFEVYEHHSLIAILFQVLIGNKKIRECWKVARSSYR